MLEPNSAMAAARTAVRKNNLITPSFGAHIIILS
jgi:hypothetical protein